MSKTTIFSVCVIFQFISLIITAEEDRTNSRCDQICNENELKLLEKLRPDCNRGCRYFNIEFLTSSGNIEKVTDLNTTHNQCKICCDQAYYVDSSKRDSCYLGCTKMYDIQSKAPYIHGWLVYMGASDRSMVLMQPDFDLVSEDDWILLDAVFHPRGEYDNLGGDPFKLTETRIQTMPIYPVRKNLTMEFCVPTWMWICPVMLVIGLIWIHYGNTIRSIFIYEDCDEDEDDGHQPPPIIKDKKNSEQDFIVALESSYFYPSPAIPIPPPKYTQFEEEFLMSDDDDVDDDINVLTTTKTNKKTKNDDCVVLLDVA